MAFHPQGFRFRFRIRATEKWVTEAFRLQDILVTDVYCVSKYPIKIQVNLIIQCNETSFATPTNICTAAVIAQVQDKVQCSDGSDKMLRYIALLLFLMMSGCLCIPERPSKWHGRLGFTHNATLTAACGEATTARKNPWAGILFHNIYRCGAVLLEHDLAITAAHCIRGYPKENFKLFFGRTFQPDSGIEDEGYNRFGEETEILDIRIHPNYDVFNEFERNEVQAQYFLQ